MKQDTRLRLLDAACDVFANEGFDKAKVADICALASANIAAVNYHFGSKKRLFFKACLHAFELSSAAFPLQKGLPENAPPEEKLRVFLLALVSQMMCKGKAGNFHRIMSRDIQHGIGKMDEVVTSTVRHNRIVLIEIIKELAGRPLSQTRTQILTHFVVSPILALNFHRLRHETNSWTPGPEKNPEIFAQMVYEYTLSGLRRLLDQKEGLYPDDEMPELFIHHLMDGKQHEVGNDSK